MAVISYLKKNTEQKQRGFIIANEYGGPIDVASWVLYHENLNNLPNTYEGKYVYVYEDNEIWYHNGTSWVLWTNNHRVAQDKPKSTPDFKLLFYQYPSNTPIDSVNENSTSVRTAKNIEVRIFVKPEGFNDWIQFNNETSTIHTGQSIDYPSKLTLRWFLNNRGNEVTSLASGNLISTSQLHEQSGFKEAVVAGNYSSSHLICVAYYNGDPIASSKLWFYGNKDATDVKRGMLYLTSKTPQLQRGFIMSSEEGGSVDATSTVNNTNDLREFTNNYLGKLVYSYSSFTDSTVTNPSTKAPKTYVDGYTYYANDKASWFPKTSLTQEEKIIEVKQKTQGRYVPIGGIDMRNDLLTRWELTGKNYAAIKSIVNSDDLGASDIPERHRRGYDIYYESHMYITINGIETEIPVVANKNDLMASNHSVGAVWYQWTIKKPLGAEYYDPGDYEPGSGGMTPSTGADPNRTVWIRDLDYKINNNDTVVGLNGETFTHEFFKTCPYTGTTTNGIVTRDGQKLECIYTNDYDDDDIVEIYCTAYFKDENGNIKTKQSPTLIVSVDNEHLVYVYPENKQGSQSGIKDITPDVGTFIIHGAPNSTTADFKLANNAYQVGYRIVHYKNATDATNRTNGTVLYLHSSNSSENVNILTLDEVVDQSSGSNKLFKFTFHVTNNTSKIPFGWYRVEVFRNTFAQSETDPDLKLYTSSPWHFFQVVSNNGTFVTPDNVWLGYYKASGQDINLDHWYRGTIKVEGKNLLTKDIPVIENGQIVKKNTTSVLYIRPNNNWVDGVETDATTGAKSEAISVNSNYTKLDGYFDFRDPRTQTTNKNRNIDLYYYGENDTILSSGLLPTYIDSISVYNVLLPDIDLVVDSVYKRPTGEDMFIYDTTGYTMVNPTPYGIPYAGCTDQSKWQQSLPSGVVTDFVLRYNQTPYSSHPKLVFKKDVRDGFEIYATVNNTNSNGPVIVDSSHYSSQDMANQRYYTGRLFSPTVYNIAVSLEQPSIRTDSDFYNTNQDYEIIAHVWWSTTDSATSTNYPGMENTPWHKYLTESSAWTEFTDAELGDNATFRWREKDNLDIWYSNTTPSTSSSRKKDLSVTRGNGGRNVYLWFTDPTLVFAYTKLDATVFGTYVTSCVEEIKVRNPIDALSVSHKIYTGTTSRLDKNYGKIGTRQLEEEWIELTVTPTLVSWFQWSDLKSTLKFVINGEEVNESSTKYKIEYEGTRNHFYEGTFKVYWKNNNQLPDSTTNFTISLNKCSTEHLVPVELVKLETIHVYPWNYAMYGGEGSFPADDLVYINAKVGTKQRFVLEVTGQNLDTDSRFLTLKRAGFKETNQDAVSLPGTEAEAVTGSDIFKKYSATSTKIVYYIEESATTNKKYTVTFNDADRSYSRVARTYLYNDQSIKGFGTSSAYYKTTAGSGYVFLESRWINISSSFEPTVIYERVVPNNIVTEASTKFTSKVEYDMHTIGIVSGSNVLSVSREDPKEVMSIDMTRSLDTFTAVIKDHSDDVSSSLPQATTVSYLWTHEGPCSVESPSNSMTLNYLTLYNDQDVDVNETVSLRVTMFKHGSRFTNYLGEQLDISDYIKTITKSFSIPKLLYDMTVNPNIVNLVIGQAYSMGEIINSIVCEMYRRDKSHMIESTTYSGTSLNSVDNKKLVFSIVNSSTKPATINNKKVAVSTDKGCDIFIEWKRTETDTKVSKTNSWTSNIYKTYIAINPKTNFWDLKEVPTIVTSVSIAGQNLKYAYSVEGDNFLQVVEKNHTDHKKSFNPGTSLANTVYSSQSPYSFSTSYTDTGHNLGYDDNHNAIDDEERVYDYIFGSNKASFTAVYQNRKINNITFDSKCVIANKTGTISTGFNIDCVNMFGPNVDIKTNEYDLTWSSAPTGSTITGKFNSSAGNAGRGTITLSQTSLADDTPISISVTREGSTKTFNGSISVSKVTSITNVSVSNGKLTLTVNGQHLDCAGNMHIGISSNDTSFTEIISGPSTNANSITLSNISYDNATYYGGIDKWFKAWIGDGNQTGQYATYKINATSPSSVNLYATNITGSTVACTATSGTLSWHGKGVANYSDGSNHTMFDQDGFSQNVGINKNCCTTKAEDLSKTVTWIVNKTDSLVSAYNLTTNYSINVTGTIHQNGDTITNTSYSYSGHQWTNTGNVGCGAITVSVTATETPVYTWTSCGSTTTGTSAQKTASQNIASNCHKTSAKTTSVTLLGATNSVTQAADSSTWGSWGSCTDFTGLTYSASVQPTSTGQTITASGTKYKYEYWNSDNAETGRSDSTSCSETCPITYDNNKYKTTSNQITGTCHGRSYTITQAADACQTSAWTLDGTPNNVGCTISSATIYVKRTATWASDGTNCDSTSDSCPKSFENNKHSTSSRTISSDRYGDCNGVAWSFEQDRDYCDIYDTSWVLSYDSNISYTTDYVTITATPTNYYRWRSDNASNIDGCNDSTGNSETTTVNTSRPSTDSDHGSKTYSDSFKGKPYSIYQSGDSKSWGDWGGCNGSSIDDYSSSVGCQAGSQTLTVRGTQYRYEYWDNGDKSYTGTSQSQPCSETCTVSYNDNCTPGNSDDVHSGYCHNLWYSITQAGNECPSTGYSGNLTLTCSGWVEDGIGHISISAPQSITMYYGDCSKKLYQQDYPDVPIKISYGNGYASAFEQNKTVSDGYGSWTFELDSNWHSFTYNVTLRSSSGVVPAGTVNFSISNGNGSSSNDGYNPWTETCAECISVKKGKESTHLSLYQEYKVTYDPNNKGCQNSYDVIYHSNAAGTTTSTVTMSPSNTSATINVTSGTTPSYC